MSEWQQVPENTPTRATITPAVTPNITSDISSHNYYGNLHDFESDTDSDRSNQSHTDSESATFHNQEFWEDEALFWEATRREPIQDAEEDAEDEIAFSYCTSSTTTRDDSFSPQSDTSDSDSDIEYNTMSYDYKNVAGFMEIKKPGITTPISEPTTVQLLAFKKVLISALRQCPLNASNKGHTYIIETLEEHRARNNNQSATLRPIPTEPVRPTAATASRAELTYYGQLTSEYNAHLDYNNQAVAILMKTFPGILDGLMIDDDLPDDMQAKDAYEHAQVTLTDTLVSRSSYLKINKAIYSREYKPSSTGPTSYFAECDNDNLMITRMGRTPHTAEIIMECALEAFAEAHNDTIDTFRKYESEWNDKKVTYAFTGTIYKEFKIYFIRQLKNLYTDKRGTHHQAHYTDTVLRRMAALEANVADNTEVLDDLVDETATEYNGTRAPPTAVTLPRRDDDDTTLASTTTMRAMMAEQATQQAAAQRAFEARIEQLVAGTGNNNSTRRPNVCRQYKFYCSSHGVNLSHSSKKCRDKLPNHNTLATYENKLGGSVKHVDWWLQFRDKDHKLCATCPPGQG